MNHFEARSDVDVLIAGAGPTGLTLACDLARRGISVRIIDKSPDFFHGSRGKGLQPRTMEIFEDLGIVDRIIAAGSEYPRMRIHWGFLAFPWSLQKRVDPSADIPYPNIWLLPQARTEAILRERLEELGVMPEMGTELSAISRDREGVTATTIEHGEPHTIRAAYLVGADGGHSFVRKSLGLGFTGDPSDLKRAVVGDVRIDGLDRKYWHAWPLAKWGAVALCPLPNSDLFQLFLQVDDQFTGELTPVSVDMLLRQALGKTRFTIRDAGWLSLYRPNVRLVDRYRVDRVFLAGDAAHVHPPAGGQGLNTGVQDAYNLGWKLAAALRGADPTILDTYEEERRPIAAHVLGMSASLYESHWERRKHDTKQLGLGYRWSSLARDRRDRPRGTIAGDRVPDARGYDENGKPQRLFDRLRGPHATLLVFGRCPPAIESEMAERGIRVMTVIEDQRDARSGSFTDPKGALREAYGGERGSWMLVRPDGHLGFVGSSESAGELTRYVDALFPARRSENRPSTALQSTPFLPGAQ